MLCTIWRISTNADTAYKRTLITLLWRNLNPGRKQFHDSLYGNWERESLLTKSLASLLNAVRWPVETEREVEQFLPVIRGDRKRLVADEGCDQVLGRVQWTRGGATPPARSWRHRSHSARNVASRGRRRVWSEHWQSDLGGAIGP